LHWWKDRKAVSSDENCLLLVVAPFSQYDLTLLDLLDEKFASDVPTGTVYVANLQDYDTVQQLNVDAPGVGSAPQTPIAVHYDSSRPPAVTAGRKARDAVSLLLGLDADKLAQRILDESPSYNRRATRHVTPPRV